MTTSVKKTPAVSKFLATPIPERLWHYTSFAGLTGIVESNSIYATDVRFLNDTEELVHARHLLEQIAEEEKEKIDDLSPLLTNALKTDIKWLFETGPLNTNFLQVFVACFSEAKDQLSQWRGYSGKTTGVSIGFDLQKLRPSFQRNLVVFAPCIYEDSEKQLLLREVVKELFEGTAQLMRSVYAAGASSYKPEMAPEDGFEEWFDNSPECAEAIEQNKRNRMSAAFNLLHIAALMKHSAFREEREWRLALPLLKGFNDQNIEMLFGAGISSLTPRTRQQLPSDIAPITEVILGPGSHSCSIDAAEKYFATRNLQPRITQSNVPFRPTD